MNVIEPIRLHAWLALGWRAQTVEQCIDTESQYQNNACLGCSQGSRLLIFQFRNDLSRRARRFLMDHERPTPDPASTPPEPNLREYESSDLLHGAKEVLIRHAGEIYRLRLTRNDKLILQK